MAGKMSRDQLQAHLELRRGSRTAPRDTRPDRRPRSTQRASVRAEQ